MPLNYEDLDYVKSVTGSDKPDVCGPFGRTWQISGRICLPCGKNLSSGHIAKCDPKFSSWKNFENREKHQRRRIAWVGQADFGKLELNNRNHGGKCQHLSAKRDQFVACNPSPFQLFYENSLQASQ